MFEKRVRETSDCLMRTFSSFCILDVFFAPCVENICRFITRHFYKCLLKVLIHCKKLHILLNVTNFH